VVASASDEDVGDISDDAASAGVVLTRAAEPVAVFVDVDLARGVVVAQESSGNDWNDILPVITLEATKRAESVYALVVDVSKREVSIDVVGEGLVTDAWHAVGDDFERDTRDVEREVDTVKESECTSKRVADDGDGSCAVGANGGVNGAEDGSRTPGVCVSETVVDFDVAADTGEQARVEVVEEGVSVCSVCLAGKVC